MMYYIKHEVIGDYANQIENGVHARYQFLLFTFIIISRFLHMAWCKLINNRL